LGDRFRLLTPPFQTFPRSPARVEGKLTPAIIDGIINGTPPDELDVYFAGPPGFEDSTGELLAATKIPARHRRRLGLSEGLAQRAANIIVDGADNSEQAPLLLRHDNLVRVEPGSSDDGSGSANDSSWWPTFPTFFGESSGKGDRRESGGGSA
jgi:hypothetical protein